MRVFALLVCGGFVLLSCGQGPSSGISTNKELPLSAHAPRCSNYGYTPNTEEFAQCLKDQAARTKRLNRIDRAYEELKKS